MPKYRVCYRRGSFSFADNCENYGEALARARYLKSQRGVWTVRLEDMAGVLVRGDFDLDMPSPALALDSCPASGPTGGDCAAQARGHAESAAISFQ